MKELTEKEKEALEAAIAESEIYLWARDNGMQKAVDALEKIAENHGLDRAWFDPERNPRALLGLE